MRRNPLRLGLGLGLCLLGASPVPSALGDDWQVVRSPFDQRLVASLKAELQRHPDDSRTLQRLIGLYRSYRTLDQLSAELGSQADRSHEPVDYLIAGHVARLRGLLDEARRLYGVALAQKDPRRPLQRGQGALWLAEVALQRKPADLEAAQQQLAAALADMSQISGDDERRRGALRKAGDVALLRGDVEGAQRAYGELLKKAGPAEQEQLRQELIAALVQKDRPKEALEQWRALLPMLHDPSRRAEAHLHMGELLFGLKDDAGAIEAYRQGLQLVQRGHHLRFDLYERLIDVHRRRDDLGGLLGQLEKEWPRDTRAFLAWQTLGRLYDEHGDVAQAVEAYRAALGKDPHHLDARRRLIGVLERSGAPGEAVIKEYERLTVEAPGEGRYHLELAERLEKTGQRARALEVLQKAAVRFAGDPSLHSALSDLYQRWGEAELALKEAEILCRIEPRDEGHIINLGELYWSRGRKDKAEEVWKRLLSVEQKSGQRAALAQARLADVYAEHNLMGQAIELYQKALKAEPQNQQTSQLRRGLALAYERLNRPRDAVALWEQVYFSYPGPPLSLEARQHLSALCGKEVRLRQHVRAWQQRFRDLTEAASAQQAELLELGLLVAEAHVNLGQLPEAEAILRRLADTLKEGRMRGEVLLGLVPVYRQQHRLPEAIAALKEAVALLPERARELYGQLSELSLQTYRDDEAVTYAERAGTDAQGELRLAELFERKDDVARAMAAYKRAVALDDRLFRAHMGLGRLHLRAGELDAAAAVYREVARRAPQEELVLEAGRKAIDLHEYLGTLGDLYRELVPLVHAYPQKTAYRRLLLSLYERYALPLLQPARRGDKEARAELQRLGQSGLKPLTEALIDGDLGEQRTAIALLGDLQNPSAAAALLRVALGPHAGGSGQRPADRQQERAGDKGGKQGVGGLGGLGAGGAMSMIGALKTPAGQADMELRAGALLAAARLGDVHSAGTFAQLAQADEKELREGALYGLLVLVFSGQPLGQKEAAVLERALRDSSADVRGLACLGLGRQYRAGGAAGLPARVRAAMLPVLQQGKSGDGGQVAALACAHAMGVLREPAALPALIDMLRDGDEELAQQAAWALGQTRETGDRRAVVPLLRAVFLRGERVRQAAAAALRAGAEGGADALLPVAERDAAGVDVRRLVARLSQHEGAAEQGEPAVQQGLAAQQAATQARVAPPVWAGEGAALLAALEEALAGHRDLLLRTLADLRPAGGQGDQLLGLGPLGQRLTAAEWTALRPLQEDLGQRLVPALKRLALGTKEEAGDRAVREQAVGLLGRLGGLPGVTVDVGDTLLAVASQGDQPVEVRLAAVAGLLSSGSAERTQAVIEALVVSPDRRLRLGALRVAAAYRQKLSLAAAQRAQRDPDGYVREAAQALVR